MGRSEEFAQASQPAQDPHGYMREDDDERGLVRTKCKCGKTSRWSHTHDLFKAQDRHAEQVARGPR